MTQYNYNYTWKINDSPLGEISEHEYIVNGCLLPENKVAKNYRGYKVKRLSRDELEDKIKATKREEMLERQAYIDSLPDVDEGRGMCHNKNKKASTRESSPKKEVKIKKEISITDKFNERMRNYGLYK